MDHIFQACPFAVGSVTVIPIQPGDGLGRGHHLVRLDKTNGLCQKGGRVGTAIRLTLASTTVKVVTDGPSRGLAIVSNHEKADALGQQIRAIVLRQGKADLELPRQIGLAIKGFFIRF